ncbi:hypothetical protein [Streptosporangium sp. NPDC087985]|uniref:hypothetical protein n=1 Tax=Streptosporangium sp. NPDC087985 TaxID=3366196 RepID=UPI0037F756D7
MLHLVLSLVGGLTLGFIGAVLSYGPGPLYAIYEPYAYLLFVAIVGRTAAGLGWAGLTSALATLGALISLLTASIFRQGDELDLGSNGAALNLALLVVASFGVLSYFTKRDDLWGDLAGGALVGIVAIYGMGKALPDWPEHVPGFWPWSALVVAGLSLGLLLSLRRGKSRFGSAFVGAGIASAYFVFASGL